MQESIKESGGLALSQPKVQQSYKKEWLAPKLVRLELSETESGGSGFPVSEDAYANGIPVS